jgi:hypothetical protein
MIYDLHTAAASAFHALTIGRSDPETEAIARICDSVDAWELARLVRTSRTKNLRKDATKLAKEIYELVSWDLHELPQGPEVDHPNGIFLTFTEVVRAQIEDVRERYPSWYEVDFKPFHGDLVAKATMVDVLNEDSDFFRPIIARVDVDLLLQLRRGTCWCEVGVDYPIRKGEHSQACLMAQDVVSHETMDPEKRK